MRKKSGAHRLCGRLGAFLACAVFLYMGLVSPAAAAEGEGLFSPPGRAGTCPLVDFFHAHTAGVILLVGGVVGALLVGMAILLPPPQKQPGDETGAVRG